MTRNELQRRYPNASESFLRRNFDRAGSAPDAVDKSDSVHEPVAGDARKIAYQSRCIIRLTSCRQKLCDERNLFDKHFVDALVEAGAFVDDSPQYVQVEVSQKLVQNDWEEATIIEIIPQIPIQ